ncbi:MAG TPA: YceI family protein [Gaiellaceae bacterium]|nr:YceI family protein [Gaiellaceae bacterium]
MSILAETSATVIPAGTWSIDPTHSTVEFVVKHLGLATVKGRAVDVGGTIEGGETPSIEGTVSVAGITTHDETRDGHLRSPDFFDAERYPELRFASTSIELVDDELVVTGEMTIKGITKPVELRGTFVGSGSDPWGNERIGVDLAGTIDRTEFGVDWNAPLPGGGFLLPDDVALYASFSAVKAA